MSSVAPAPSSPAALLAEAKAYGDAASAHIAPRLAGKCALITGAGSGIGAETAIRFAREGANVLLVGRRVEKLNTVVEQIRKVAPNVRAVAFAADVSLESGNKDAVEAALKQFGKLHIAFNNAGIFRGTPITATDSSTFREVFTINVEGVLYGMKYQIPAIEKSGGGSIINTSSALGLRANLPGVSIYSATKFALEAISQTAALEAAPLKIRVNTIAPGPIYTEVAGPPEATVTAISSIVANTLMKRGGHPAEIAAAVAFLASDEAAFITGSSLVADGGILAR